MSGRAKTHKEDIDGKSVGESSDTSASKSLTDRVPGLSKQVIVLGGVSLGVVYLVYRLSQADDETESDQEDEDAETDTSGSSIGLKESLSELDEELGNDDSTTDVEDDDQEWEEAQEQAVQTLAEGE